MASANGMSAPEGDGFAGIGSSTPTSSGYNQVKPKKWSILLMSNSFWQRLRER
jgi:hypothetical protein